MVVIAVLIAFGGLHGSACAATIWSEDFDSLSAGTVLTSANMPGWTFKGTEGGSTAIATTSDSAASSPNAVSHLGNGGSRGNMFHDATGVSELRFSFYRREKTNPVNYQTANTEIGFTSNQDLNIYNQMTGPKVIFYMEANQAASGATMGFYTQESEASPYVNRWDLLGVLDDSTWHDGLIRFETDSTLTFGYKALADTDFTLSGGHAPLAAFTPDYVGVSFSQHMFTNGRTYLDNINAVPEPSSVVSLITLGFCGLFFTWRRRRRAA